MNWNRQAGLRRAARHRWAGSRPAWRSRLAKRSRTCPARTACAPRCWRPAAFTFPDPQKATAGIHFINVVKKLGILAEVEAALRPFPNGATAMAQMAQADEPGLLGCTQVTEILYTPGVTLVSALPAEFELATVYTAAMTTRAGQPELARQLIAALSGDASRALREQGGFEL